MLLFLAEPTLGASEEAPRGKVEAVGPMGQVGRPGGRPACPRLQPPPTAGGWACLGFLLSKSCGTACLNWICFGPWAPFDHLSLILCSDIFCDFLSGQSVLATCKISSKPPAHILKHHMWNLLINKPILAFIPHYG